MAVFTLGITAEKRSAPSRWLTYACCRGSPGIIPASISRAAAKRRLTGLAKIKHRPHAFEFVVPRFLSPKTGGARQHEAPCSRNCDASVMFAFGGTSRLFLRYLCVAGAVLERESVHITFHQYIGFMSCAGSNSRLHTRICAGSRQVSFGFWI
jgi:hypothetical protein